MDITQTIAAKTAGATTGASAPAADAAGDDSATMITSDFETFLTMLTTQMENQDPLNPIESTDFAVQLATFSGVEQQVQTNDLLEAMMSQFSSGGMSEYATWVGMEARAVTAAAFDGDPVTLYPEPSANAEAVEIVVRDVATGATVDRLYVPVSNDPVEWDGLDDKGDPFPEGEYTFHLKNIEGGGNFTEEQIAIYSEVQELRLVNGETRLILAGGGDIAAAEVTAVRQPKSDEG